MPSGEPRVPIDRLREAVREASGRTSDYVVAAEIGMSRPWVRGFLKGAKPQPATVRKLNLWYIRYRSETGSEELDGRTAEVAMGLFLTRLPEAEREDARLEVYRVIARRHRAAGVGEPRWVREARGAEGEG